MKLKQILLSVFAVSAFMLFALQISPTSAAITANDGYDAFYDVGLDTYNAGNVQGPTWGNWTFSSDSAMADNMNLPDFFAMSTIKVGENQSFVLEGTLDISGVAAGLVFGVPNNSDPGAAWYCINIDKSNMTSRIFSVKTGTLGVSNAYTFKQLSNSDFTDGKVTLRIEGTSSGFITGYINGEPLGSAIDTQFKGGYLGLQTCFSKTQFTNLKYKIYNNETDAFSNIEIEGTDFVFEQGEQSYELEVQGAQPLNVKVSGNENYDFYINGVNNSESYVPIDGSRTLIRVSAINKLNTNRTDTKIMINSKYSEEYRPQYHFTPEKNWMNDPNGLLYDAYTGEYHIFFQYCKSIIPDGQLYWGHAVSKDLVHYEELEPAIAPDNYGVMWSGNGVIDYNNASGLFDESTPAESRMVIIYSVVKFDVNVDGINRRIEQQALAYSKDHGRTWIKYNGGVPIIDNDDFSLGEFRDGKIVWIDDKSKENGGFWLMITGGYTRTRLWTSDNLLDWKLNSEIFDKDGSPIVTECPDFFELEVDGNKDNKKWVLSAGGTYYVIGQLKEICGNYYFVAESDKNKAYLTTNNAFPITTGAAYATVSFFNDKSDRRIMVSWMVDYTASNVRDKYWNGALSSFMETTLKTVNGEISLVSYPISEYEAMRSTTLKEINNVQLGTDNIVSDVKAKVFDLEIEFSGTSGKAEFIFSISGDKCSKIIYDANKGEVTLDLSKSGSIISSVLTLKVYPKDGKVTLRIMVDCSIIDVYVNGGEQVLQSLYFPPENDGAMSLTATDAITLDNFVIYQMKSSWEDFE